MAAACCVTEPGRNIMGGGCGDKRLCSLEWRLSWVFRETVATEGTAAMEAIFGHGLVDSGAAAAQIGNLTYALGPDVSLGQDLSQSKLSLPAGMGRDLAN